jgi:broad specificity phosphatase PhoE
MPEPHLSQTIFLTRHGETHWNRERRFQGRMDSPLTERGIEQARRMGRTLRRFIDASAGWEIVASPLGRAHRTASILADEIGLPSSRIHLDERLMELDMGCWEGLTGPEIEARTPGCLSGCPPYEVFFTCPDGETYDAFVERLAAWKRDHGERRRLIVVAHGLVSRILRGLYAGLDRSDLLQLEIPQDALFRIAGGAVERIDCATGPWETVPQEETRR